MRTILPTLLAACVLAAPASAMVLVDRSPGTVLAEGIYTAPAGWANQSAGQNFLVKFTLAEPATITSMTSWAWFDSFRPVGDPLVLKLAADVGGRPDYAALQILDATLSEIIEESYFLSGADRAVFGRVGTFAPIDLAAGSWWIGLTKAGGPEMAWGALESTRSPNNVPGQERLLGNNPFLSDPAVGQLLWNLNGTREVISPPPPPPSPPPIPEPATWAMLIAGFGMIGAALRRRRPART